MIREDRLIRLPWKTRHKSGEAERSGLLAPATVDEVRELTAKAWGRGWNRKLATVLNGYRRPEDLG